jgi:rhodanese-related sulfurtransferase
MRFSIRPRYTPIAYLGQDGSREELRICLRAGNVIVLDVRSVEEYRAGGIPGALSVPVAELAYRINELPEEIEVVVYCRGEYCFLAYDGVRRLTDRGPRAVRLGDGMFEWRRAALLVDAGRPA